MPQVPGGGIRQSARRQYDGHRQTHTEDCLPMLNHISFGVADLARSRTFYDAVLKPLGLACTSPGNTSLGYGDAAGAIPLWLLAAKKPVRAEAQNGQIGRAHV